MCGAPMYSCLGVLAARMGGIIDLKKCYSSLPRDNWKVKLKMTSRAEAAFESFADAGVIHQMINAKKGVPIQTMSSPHSNNSAKYFGAMANLTTRCEVIFLPKWFFYSARHMTH